MSLDRDVIRKEAMNIDFEWKKFFTAEELNRLARKTNFCKRNSKKNKITGATFFDLVVMNTDILKGQSLKDLSVDMSLKNKMPITAQSINERFNLAAVSFFKSILEHVICKQLDSTTITIGGAFKRLLIKDSTCFQLPKELNIIYPGSGGAGSKAAIRIQFEFDLFTGTVTDLSLNAFNTQDAINSEMTLDCITEGDLVVRDLAYMHKNVFNGISQRIAGYLCRLGHNTSVYELKSSGMEKLDYHKLLTYMQENNLTMLEKSVLITESKVPTRLLIYRLPENVVEKRLRNKHSEAERKGRKPLSKEYISRQYFNLIITNATAEEISLEDAYKVYTLRWQIELIFKTWKTLVSIDKIKSVKQFRLECYIYAKLILIMMNWKLFWKLNLLYWKNFRCPLSQFKFYKTFIKKLPDLAEVLRSKSTVRGILEDINSVARELKLDIKKGTKSAFEMIEALL